MTKKREECVGTNEGEVCRHDLLPALVVEDLKAGYGKREVLHRVSFTVASNTLVAMIGPNAAGKSTVLKAVSGLLPGTRGSITLYGTDITNASPRHLAALGVGYVPQVNNVFSALSVTQNLQLSAYASEGRRQGAGLEYVRSLFPRLLQKADSPAGLLSGGERQLLAIAMALARRPRLLLLDEPSRSMGTLVARELLAELARSCEKYSLTALVVEQRVREVLEVAHSVVALRQGVVDWAGPTCEFEPAYLRQLFLS